MLTLPECGEVVTLSGDAYSGLPNRICTPNGVWAYKAGVAVCETPAGDPVEVVAKFSVGCDQGVSNLAREAVAVCLAGALELPVPEPFLIEITPEWLTTISNPGERARIQSSSPVAFGSRFITGQYAVWSPGTLLRQAMLPTASAIFVFDAITQNPDRRTDNPNCLVKGDEFIILDHEMTFTHGFVIGWRPPWFLGGLTDLRRPGFHIFWEQLRQRELDFAPIRRAWQRWRHPTRADSKPAGRASLQDDRSLP